MNHKPADEGMSLLIATLHEAKVQQSSLGELASAGAGLLIASLQAMSPEARAPYLQAINSSFSDDVGGKTTAGSRGRLN